MTEGTVKFFNPQKQFGFINGDDGKSYFFHSTQVEQGTRLTEGDRVSFTGLQGERGPKAEHVKKLAKSKEAESGSEESEESEATEEELESEIEEAEEEEEE
jgi:CspA family cold shock protein